MQVTPVNVRNGTSAERNRAEETTHTIQYEFGRTELEGEDGAFCNSVVHKAVQHGAEVRHVVRLGVQLDSTLFPSGKLDDAAEASLRDGQHA